jgi:hypothetical protein
MLGTVIEHAALIVALMFKVPVVVRANAGFEKDVIVMKEIKKIAAELRRAVLEIFLKKRNGLISLVFILH